MPEADLSEERMFMSFLGRTRAGEFAPIQETSLLYLRMNEQTERIEDVEEEYFYCIS